MGQFSFTHLLLVAIILLIFFGPSRLPALAQSLGKSIRDFKKAMNEVEVEAKEVPPQQNQALNQPQQNQQDPVNTAAREKDKKS